MTAVTIWYRDIESFLRRANWGKIWFRRDDPPEVKLNNMFRFSVYYSIAMMLISRKSWPMVVGMTVAAITYVMYESGVDTKQHPGRKQNIDTRHDLENDNIAVRRHKKTVRDDSKLRQPSMDNPYMNRLVTDMTAEGGDECADVRDPHVQKRMRELHNDGVPMDAKDIFGRNTSERTFYTMPVTDIVSDQDTFARWLFRPNDGVTFKERGVLFHQ